MSCCASPLPLTSMLGSSLISTGSSMDLASRISDPVCIFVATTSVFVSIFVSSVLASIFTSNSAAFLLAARCFSMAALYSCFSSSCLEKYRYERQTRKTRRLTCNSDNTHSNSFTCLASEPIAFHIIEMILEASENPIYVIGKPR